MTDALERNRRFQSDTWVLLLPQSDWVILGIGGGGVVGVRAKQSVILCSGSRHRHLSANEGWSLGWGSELTPGFMCRDKSASQLFYGKPKCLFLRGEKYGKILKLDKACFCFLWCFMMPHIAQPPNRLSPAFTFFCLFLDYVIRKSSFTRLHNHGKHSEGSSQKDFYTALQLSLLQHLQE